MRTAPRSSAIILSLIGCLTTSARAADLVALSPQTWQRFAPHGKEADAIYGDFAISNSSLVAVIAHPNRGRNANMTVREVGGCLIDLTEADRQNDQLSAYYPGGGLRELKFAGVEVHSPTTYETADLGRLFVQAQRVTLRLVATPKEKEPDLEVAYTLDDTWSSLLVTSTFTNRRDRPVEVELVDSIRADGTSFEFSAETNTGLFWAYDKHFGQAYGIEADDRRIIRAASRQQLLRYADKDGKVTVRLAPSESFRLTRHLIPGANLFDVHRKAQARSGKRTAVGYCRSQGHDGASHQRRGRRPHEGRTKACLGTNPS